MKAIVVGGGIGGLALAATLGNRKIECVVHERRPAISSAGSGLVLHPNGLAALRQIAPALHSEVSVAGYSTPENAPSYLLSGDGRILSKKFFPPDRKPVAIRRADLHQILRSYARKAQVLHGSTCMGYEAGRAGVRATVTRDDPREGRSRELRTEQVRGDVLIGADGLNSGIRKQLLNDGAPSKMGLTSIKCIAKIDHDDPFLRGGFVLFGRGHQAFCAPLGPDVVYWDVTICSGSALRSTDLGQTQRDLLSARWNWPLRVADMIAAATPTDMIVTELSERRSTSRWSAGPVALLGDAAHPMSPFLGQGTNQALLDAVVLAEELSAHGENPATAFHHYESQRRGVATRAMRDSRRIGFDGQTRNPVLRWRRDRSLRRSALRRGAMTSDGC